MTREEKIKELRKLAACNERNVEYYELQIEALEAAGMPSGMERSLLAGHKRNAEAFLDHAMRLACEEEV